MLYTNKLNVIYKTELIIDSIDCLKIRNKNIIHNTHAQYILKAQILQNISIINKRNIINIIK